MNNFCCSGSSKEKESTYQTALSGSCYWQGFCKSRCYDEMFCGFVLGSMLGRAGYTLICMSCDIFLSFPFLQSFLLLSSLLLGIAIVIIVIAGRAFLGDHWNYSVG